MWAVRSVPALAVTGAITVALAWPHRRPEPPPPVAYADEDERSCTPPDVSAFTGDERVLADAWAARHRCWGVPRCFLDPIVTLQADLDDTPGVERVIADQRFGVALLSARGEVLATADFNHGCPEPALRLSLGHYLPGRHPQLVVDARVPAGCGTADERMVVERDGDELAARLDAQLGGRVGCAWTRYDVDARVSVPRPGTVVIDYAGAAGDIRSGAWLPVHDTCTYRADGDRWFESADAACYRFR
jgi:hypothetical protein